MIPIGQEKIKILTRFRSLTKHPRFRQYAKMNESPTDRLKVLGLTLPPAPKPVAAYLPFVRTGNLVYVSGQLPFQDGKLIATGSVPSKTSIEAAAAAARQCVLNGLAVLADAAGGLDRIHKICLLYTSTSPRD